MALTAENFVDVATAAGRADRSERQIRRWCKDKKLVHRIEKGAYLIDPKSLEQLVSGPPGEASANEDAKSDTGGGLGSESNSNCGPKPDVDSDADIRTSTEDLDRTSDVDKNIALGIPTDIAAVSEKLRTSQEAMFETANLLLQRLCFEQRRNRSIEGRL